MEISEPISYEEVKRAVLSMNSNNSSGFDGFPAAFFHNNWDTLGSDIFQMVQTAYPAGTFLVKLNHTLITLIPKMENPKRSPNFDQLAYARS